MIKLRIPTTRFTMNIQKSFSFKIAHFKISKCYHETFYRKQPRLKIYKNLKFILQPMKKREELVSLHTLNDELN